MTKRDVVRLDRGPYSFSIAWFGDSVGRYWGWVRLGHKRWAFDIWRFRIRFEKY